jgi:hypothetical protein
MSVPTVALDSQIKVFAHQIAENDGALHLSSTVNDAGERLKSNGHPTVILKRRKAAANKVSRVPAICPLNTQIIPPSAIAPWDTTIMIALSRPRTEFTKAR